MAKRRLDRGNGMTLRGLVAVLVDRVFADHETLIRSTRVLARLAEEHARLQERLDRLEERSR